MIIRMFKSKIFFCALPLLIACQQESTMEFSSYQNNIVPKVISAPNTRAITDDGQLIATYNLSEDSLHPLYLHVFEKELTTMPCDSASTRGTEIKAEDLAEFYMKAYAEEDWEDPVVGSGFAGEYIAFELSEKDGDEWVLMESTPWLNDVPITFWSWYPDNAEPEVDFSDGTDMASLTWNLYNKPSTEDILIAFNREKRTIAANGIITAAESSNPHYTEVNEQFDIEFYHPLSAIKFDVSGLTGATLSNVTLQNIYRYATCAITVTAGIPQFTWTPTAAKQNFSQAFTATDFKTDGTMKDGSDKVFFLIPQTLRDDAALEIQLKKASDPTDIVNLTKSIAKANATDTENVTWEPGKIYTYKLTSNPFDYTWNYVFSFKDDDNSQKTEVYAVKEYNIIKNIDISSLKVREDDPSIGGNYGYHIKSYQVEGEAVQTVDGTSFSETAKTGMTNVSLQEDCLSLQIAKRTPISVGSNAFWKDEEDKALHPEWHPDDWTSQTSGNPIDLSTYNFRTDTRDALSMTTANCYVIRHAGWYKLPLVYGNAMKNGADNQDAYSPFPSDNDDNDLTLGTFKNHLDADITSPFIENHTGCKAYSCALLWQTCGEVIKDLRFSTNSVLSGTNPYNSSNVRYLEFYADPEEICQNNSLIVIKDANGKIIWSWQIWSTNDPALLEDDIEVTNRVGNKYYFMNIPSLGRVTKQEYPTRPDITITLEQNAPSTEPPLVVTVKQPDITKDVEYVVYQFGRKDPILGTSTDVEFLPAPVSLGTLIQNPNTFYTFSYSYTPYRKQNYECPNTPKFKNLWSGKDTQVTGGAIEQNTNMIKTIYDPSPIGYKVPACGAFTGFTTTGKQAFRTELENWNCESTNVDELGYANFYTSLGPGYTVNFGAPTIHFPQDGMRAGYTGNILRTSAMYYSCNYQCIKAGEGPDCGTDSYMLGVSSNSVGMSTASPCNGHNVRPVRE